MSCPTVHHDVTSNDCNHTLLRLPIWIPSLEHAYVRIIIYTEVHIDENLSSIVRAVTTNKEAPYCVDTRLKQDIRSTFVLNYSVFRQEIAQRTILITGIFRRRGVQQSDVTSREKTGERVFSVLPI